MLVVMKKINITAIQGDLMTDYITSKQRIKLTLWQEIKFYLWRRKNAYTRTKSN
jgi:hypothetical protein